MPLVQKSSQLRKSAFPSLRPSSCSCREHTQQWHHWWWPEIPGRNRFHGEFLLEKNHPMMRSGGEGGYGVRPKGWRLAGKWVGMYHIWKELDFNASRYHFLLVLTSGWSYPYTMDNHVFFLQKAISIYGGKTPSGPSGLKMMTPLCLNTSFGGKFILGFCAIGCMWFNHRSCASCKISSFYKHPSPKSNIYHSINRFNSIGKLTK